MRLPILLMALLAALAWNPKVSLAGNARKKAAAEYDRAVSLRAELESRPQRSRSIGDYRALILAFQAVYKTDPAYQKSPAALADAAQLSEEMGWQFSDKRYYVASIEDYRFLITQYPECSLSRDALYTMGEIYRVDLIQPNDAQKIFQRFIALYPNAPKAKLAREKLKQIQQFEAKSDSESPRVLEGDLPPEPGAGVIASQARTQAGSKTEIRNDTNDAARPLETTPPPSEARETAPERGGKLPQVTGVRFWGGPNYTRVVIALDDEVKFNSTRLAHPDRLVFDLAGCRLSSSVAGKAFPVGEGGFLRQVRFAQFRPTVARAVLDVRKIGEYSIFSLPNPFRLVIDIRGSGTKPAPQEAVNDGSIAIAEENSKPAPSANQSGRASGSGIEKSQAGEGGVIVEKEGAVASAPPSPDARRQLAHTLPYTATRPQDSETPADDRSTASPPPKGTVAAGPTVQRFDANGLDRGVAAKDTSPAPVAPDEGGGSRTLTRVLGLKIGRIVIDPGHGGHDTGALGPHGLREKDLVLDVGLRLRALLERKTQAEVVMTRSDDTFIPLEERTAIANQKAADLFISIHANASRDSSARAIETYYLNFTSDPRALEVAARENASSSQSVHELQSLVKKIVLTEKIQESHDFAADVQSSLYSGLTAAGAREENHGVKRAPFVVLIGASMPSILAEISFVTNPRDEKLLKRPEYRQKIAEALYRGVQRYTRNLGGLRYAEQPQPTAPALRASRDAHRAPAIATVAPSIPSK